MSRSLIQSQTGKLIQRAFVELWKDATHLRGSPVCVGIEFQYGKGFIFTCAGDGGISIRKGRLESSSLGETQSFSLVELEGMAFDSFESGNDFVTLCIGNSRMTIANRDDELEVTVIDQFGKTWFPPSVR